MFTIMRNLWIDKIRSSQRHPEHLAGGDIEHVADGDRVGDRAEARSDLRSISRAMEQLPPDQLSVLTLVAIEGRSYQEAATILDVPVGTIMSRLHRARSRLTAALEGPTARQDGGSDATN
jgi:RNA polymerase sigma-70 factor (ECF subfamily)